ncbi:unnamed protein product [Prunus armeniaca]
MGFCNLHEFNLALLAKQCWRILMEPQSLWVKVLKGRYFPNVSFLETKKSGRTSWAWASLLVGRDILLRGAHWQNLRVEAIINRELDEWNLDLIRHAISDSDARAITRIKFGSSTLPDRLIWPMERNGSYSVRSGYHWLHNIECRRRNPRPSSSMAIDPRLWK